MKNKNAIVTGASSGIGREVAIKLASMGANVLIGARTEDNLNETKELCEIQNKSSSIFSAKLDLTDKANVATFCSIAKEKLSGVDILINCAGYIEPKLLHETTDYSWDNTIGVNLNGPFYMYRELYKSFNDNGAIVNVSSIAGIQGVQRFPAFGSYTASKMGLGGLTEIMAVELKKRKIRVNAICPSAVDTKMLKTAMPKLEHSKKVNVLTVEQVANHIMFYVSDESIPATGQMIVLK